MVDAEAVAGLDREEKRASLSQARNYGSEGVCRSATVADLRAVLHGACRVGAVSPTGCSPGELALDEPRQAAQRLERRRADLVVGDRDAEMLFQAVMRLTTAIESSSGTAPSSGALSSMPRRGRAICNVLPTSILTSSSTIGRLPESRTPASSLSRGTVIPGPGAICISVRECQTHSGRAARRRRTGARRSGSQYNAGNVARRKRARAPPFTLHAAFSQIAGARLVGMFRRARRRVAGRAGRPLPPVHDQRPGGHLARAARPGGQVRQQGAGPHLSLHDDDRAGRARRDGPDVLSDDRGAARRIWTGCAGRI